MNLQEQILRIHEMMDKSSLYKKMDLFQKLVDKSIASLKNICETMNSEDDEIVSFDACEFIDNLVQVKVTSVDTFNENLRILIYIKYKNWRYMEEESFVYELSDELKKTIGPNVIVEVEDLVNTFPEDQRNW